MRVHSSRRGTTFVELIVYTALFAMIASAVAAAFTAGNRWYQTTRSVISAEQDAQNLPYRLGQELMESNLGGITFYPNSNASSARRGIVFIAPRNPSAGNAFGFNPLTGRARWYKYVCFYVQSDPENPGATEVVRKEWVPAGLDPDARPVACVNTTDWFRTNTSLAQVVIAHNVLAPTDTLLHGGFDVFSGDPETTSPNYDSASNPICVSVSTGNGGSTAQMNTVKTTLLTSARN